MLHTEGEKLLQRHKKKGGNKKRTSPKYNRAVQPSSSGGIIKKKSNIVGQSSKLNREAVKSVRKPVKSVTGIGSRPSIAIVSFLGAGASICSGSLVIGSSTNRQL